MKRLPGTDRSATRAETRAFGGLALAGVGAISLALVACAQFVTGQDAVVAALEARPHPGRLRTAEAACCAATNAAPPETKAVAATGRTKA